MQDLIEDINDQLKQKVIENNVFLLFQKVIELKMKSEYGTNISEFQSLALELSNISINFNKIKHNVFSK